jgi:hypothetical protein
MLRFCWYWFFALQETLGVLHDDEIMRPTAHFNFLILLHLLLSILVMRSVRDLVLVLMRILRCAVLCRAVLYCDVMRSKC